MTIKDRKEMNDRDSSPRSLPVLSNTPSSTSEFRRQTTRSESASPGPGAIDADISARLRASKTPDEYWRSLDELDDTPEFREWLHREFPENASEWRDPKGRRQFLKLMGASLALAGLTA